MNEVRTKLFTNITHEFRTPLTVIRGMAGLIEKHPEEWTTEGTEKIKNNSDILLNLVNQMLEPTILKPCDCIRLKCIYNPQG